MPPYLSVVIPAFNEADRILPTLAAVDAFAPAAGGEVEVIVADDGSTDATAQRATGCVLRHVTLRHLPLPHRGKGAAVRDGLLAASGKYRLFMDADGTIPVSSWGTLRPLLEAGMDVAVGSKRGASEIPLLRTLSGRCFQSLVAAFGLRGFSDTQCGFKAFTASAVERIFPGLRTEGFAFDVEVLWRARRAGLAVAEAPVTYRFVSGSRVHLWREAPVMIGTLLRLRFRDQEHLGPRTRLPEGMTREGRQQPPAGGRGAANNFSRC